MTMLYDPVVYDRTQAIGSYWDAVPPVCAPLQQSQSCEVAIIGGGITGLSAALHLACDYGVEAQILEAGVPGWGASGRNGGFCCIGATKLSNTELIKRFGLPETRHYFQNQREGIDLVRQIAEQETIDVEPQGDGCIQVAHRPSRWQELEAEHEFLTKVAGYPCTLWSQQELAEQGFRSPEAYGALHVGVGFGLNPGKYSSGLARAAVQRGATIYAHSAVEHWDKADGWHQLHTPGGTLKARSVIVATNGYTEDRLHPELGDRLLPALSNIITTRPLTDAELSTQGWLTETPVWDTRHLLFYYRLLKDRRFLFGSRGGTGGGLAERDRYRVEISDRLGQMFPAWKEVEITHFWNGLVAISANLTPHIGRLAVDPSIFYGLAYHGNGVAMATWSGRAIARLMMDQETAASLCPVVTQPLKRFPFPALRIWYLRSAYAAYQIQDALG
jgi:glycine/D-amino acid oxidase-like deaminating enzyme